MADMNLEENRLRTFYLWPSNAPIDAENLARNGFYATGNYMETQCNWCQKKISDWQYGDQIIIRHRRVDPLCSFILNPTNSGNIPINQFSSNANNGSSSSMSSSNETTTTATVVTNETSSTAAIAATASHHHHQQQKSDLDGIQQQQQQEQHIPSAPQIDLKNEMCRLATFKNWPNPNISPQSLAKAGFYYINKSDQVKCAWCQGIIAKWEKNDNAFDEHQRFFPNCPRVKLGPLIEIASDGIRDLGIQQISPPRKPKFSSLDARLRTYARWPIAEIQKPEILAQAGFYYQQIDDQVRCFHCNGGLRSWQKEDDPWFEHAKWFPLCQFLKLVKGQGYINQVQEIGRQTCYGNTTTNNGHQHHHYQQEQHKESSVVGVPQSQQTPMTLDEAMVSEPVRQALEMGLNEGRIRSATKRQLDYCGRPFETTEELVEAVLEGQANEEDDGSSDLSSSIVREVSRILNNIFNPRNRSDSDNFDELTEDDDDSLSAAATVGFYRNSVTSPPAAQQQQQHATTVVATAAITTPTNINDLAHFVPDTAAITNNRSAAGVSTNNSSTVVDSTANDAAATAASNANSDAQTQRTSSPSTMIQSRTSAGNAAEIYSDAELTKQLSLEEENRKLKDARLCKVCMDEEVGVVFLPCGHLVTCVQCAPGVTLCPLCRSTIKGFVRTFLS